MSIVSLIFNGVSEFILNLANDFLALGFDILTTFLLEFSDINKYIDINIFLVYSQAIACALLSATVSWNAFKTQSGGVFKGGNSLSVLATKTIFAGAAIFFLPHLVMKILIPINNFTVKAISQLGKDYTITTDSMLESIQKLNSLGIGVLFGTLILSIAIIILSIISAIRYIDLILCIIISPLVALSIVEDGESLSTWGKETIAIVFTQSIHILLLQILMKIMIDVSGIPMLILATGTVVVMIRGANILRTYTYNSGFTAGALSMSSIALMKTDFGKLKSKFD